MKILLAGMHTTPNQFTRGIQNLGCHWAHWHGSAARENMPTNCDAVVIAKCQISHAAFWRAKEAYLGMNKPIFVSSHSFTEVAEPMQEWLKSIGHLDELGRPKPKERHVEAKPVNTAMSHAFKQAEVLPPKPPEEKPVANASHSFEQIKPIVDKMIQEEHAKDLPWKDIADKLNQHHLTTPSGKPWTTAALPAYALTRGLVGRRANTSAGPAGSTGKVVEHHKTVEAKPRIPRKLKEQFTEAELEEIMTSNLHTGLKLRVIKLLTLSEV